MVDSNGKLFIPEHPHQNHEYHNLCRHSMPTKASLQAGNWQPRGAHVPHVALYDRQVQQDSRTAGLMNQPKLTLCDDNITHRPAYCWQAIQPVSH
jgi:hypothetical protein